MMSMLGPIDAARPSAHRIGRAAMAHVQELGVMAAVAAMAPLGRAGRSFERAVDALLPVAAQGAATARPVLLVHGFAGTKSCWLALAPALHARGMTVDAIDYLPFGTSIERLAERLAVKVARLQSETGADKVHLVGHSLGGSSSRRRSPTVASPDRSIRSSPSQRLSGVRRGQICFRLGRPSGRCGTARRCCVDSPPHRYQTACGGWLSARRTT